MQKKSTILLSLSLAFFLLFALFTAALLFVDVQTISYGGGITAEIGFAGINQTVFSALGTNELFYNVTDLLGLAALAVAAAFALLGFYQLVKRRRILAVDPAILLLACLYVLVALFYIGFEMIELNFRPILIEGVAEASFPSSHTLLACVIFASAPIALASVFGRKRITLAASLICALLAALTAVGRLLAGVHWLTDIVGALLLSAALVLLYAFVLSLLQKNQKTEKM